MHKKMMYLIGGLVVAGGGYLVYQKMKSVNGSLQPSNQFPEQPSQLTVWAPPTSQRVDNQNQPFYGGPTGFINSGGNYDLAAAASNIQSASSIIQDVSSVWDNLSGFFDDSGVQTSN